MARQLSLDETAAPLVPETSSLTTLRKAAAGCKACDLWKTGTQTVFGEGARKAEALFVGEQPGDQEDQQGKPFVGPAGRVLDEGLEEAGIDRALGYVTNVVKHFKWEPRGKRRIHAKPNWAEIAACRPWLEPRAARDRDRAPVVDSPPGHRGRAQGGDGRLRRRPQGRGDVPVYVTGRASRLPGSVTGRWQAKFSHT